MIVTCFRMWKDHIFRLAYWKCGCCGCGRVRKDILCGVSLYFNPGELVGIMGSSGDNHMTKYMFIIRL